MIDALSTIARIGGAGGMDALAQARLRALAPDVKAAPAASAAQPGEASFLAALRKAAGEAVATLENSERVAMQGIRGQADIREVVDSVMAAERTLSAAIAIRNKVVSAWLEISRMQI